MLRFGLKEIEAKYAFLLEENYEFIYIFSMG